jgi:hypothetical protein
MRHISGNHRDIRSGDRCAPAGPCNRSVRFAAGVAVASRNTHYVAHRVCIPRTSRAVSGRLRVNAPPWRVDNTPPQRSSPERPSAGHQDYPTGSVGKADLAASQLYFQRSTSPLLTTTFGARPVAHVWLSPWRVRSAAPRPPASAAALDPAGPATPGPAFGLRPGCGRLRRDLAEAGGQFAGPHPLEHCGQRHVGQGGACALALSSALLARRHAGYHPLKWPRRGCLH